VTIIMENKMRKERRVCLDIIIPFCSLIIVALFLQLHNRNNILLTVDERW